jgi:hypothetical protein
MNERIQLLAEQATTRVDAVPNESMAYTYFDTKMFAELIVRKCVSILMTPEYPMNHPEELADYNRGWVNGRQLGIEHIREQFGVEE